MEEERCSLCLALRRHWNYCEHKAIAAISATVEYYLGAR